MQLELKRSKHPYYRDIGFTSAEIAGFPAYDRCPCCTSAETPETVAELGSGGPETAVGVVQCRACDHLYYRNPPPADFFAKFYREVWNARRGEGASDEPAGATRAKSFAAELAGAVGLGREASVLEIGCGVGAMLLGLRDAGFENLHGTEASDFRAASTAKLFPGRIYSGGYEAAPDEARFDLIYSHHVVEHIYDPAAAFDWMSAHLNPSGVIVVTVPDAWTEPVLNQLLFLPHLHSFCHRALMKMGEAKGYDCAFWTKAKTPHEICAVFSKGPRRGWDDRQFVQAKGAPDVEPRRQYGRVGKLFELAGENRYFALHAGEDGTMEMRTDGGVRALNAFDAQVATLGVGLGRILTRFGFRKLGDKRLGRRRFIEVEATPGAARAIVGADNRAPFHIK